MYVVQHKPIWKCDKNMGKESEKEWKQINVSEKTEQQIRYTAKILNKTISGFLEELFDCVIRNSVNFRDGANIQFIFEGDDIRLRFSGSKIVCAQAFKVDDRTTNAQVDRMLTEKTLAQAKQEGHA